MKPALTLGLAALRVVLGSAIPADVKVSTTAAEECGDLGVMPVPAGEDPAKYRKCLRHPLEGKQPDEPQHAPENRHAGDLSHLELEGAPDLGPPDWIDRAMSKPEDAPGHILAERACFYGAGYGCTGNNVNNKYCWKRCGDPLSDGKWCWTAADGGGGPWLKCTLDNQCNPLYVSAACGGACSC